jgi:hypothetical protein
MDPNIVGSLVTTLINTCYPGGSSAFTKDGGSVSYAPGYEENVLLYHPNIPQQLADAIEIFNNRNSVKINVVDKLNFEGASISEVITMIDELMQTIIGSIAKQIIVNPYDPLVLPVAVSGEVSEDAVEIISEKLKTLPGLLRAYLVVNGTVYPVNVETSETIVKVHQEPDRVKITDDSIADLKIELSQEMDVLDFINRL